MSQVNIDTTETTATPVTEVTSIAKEEQKSGVKINTPSREELVARASSSMIVDLQRLNQLINGKLPGNKFAISRAGMNRVLLAIMSLPTEGIPVNLKTKEEKLAFAFGQKLISSRFILIQDQISQEIAKQRETNNQTETKVEGEQNGNQ